MNSDLSQFRNGAHFTTLIGGANSTNPNHYHANHHPEEPTRMYPPINQANKRWFELY